MVDPEHPLVDIASVDFHRGFEETRARVEVVPGAERSRSKFEETTLKGEIDRLRMDRERDWQAHRDELAALHETWEAERRGWRQQLEAAHRKAQLERESARSAEVRLRAESEVHARLSIEHETHAISSGVAITTLLKEADEHLLALNALHREREKLRDEVEALREGRCLPSMSGTEDDSAIKALQVEYDELSRTREVFQLALNNTEAAATEAARIHAERLAEEQTKVAELNVRLETVQAEALRLQKAARSDQLPILSQDLARWSTPPPATSDASTVPQAPPTADDLAVADRQVEMLRMLIRRPTTPGRPLHTHFDETRYAALQSRLRESALLADRLFNQVERSRSSKDLLWHLMVAQRTEELNRNKRR